MRTVVIGGTGHIGTYLVPALVRSGMRSGRSVAASNRRTSPTALGRQVELVQVDRQAEDAAGTFGAAGRATCEPDVVIDLICFTEDSARQLVEAVEGKIQHLLHCGTIWVHGPSMTVPTREDAPRKPFGDYGVAEGGDRAYLLGKARRDGLPATIIHPGHISGPGWTPVNPAGNFDLGVFEKLAHGHDVLLPNLGLETLNPVHAADVAGRLPGRDREPVDRDRRELPRGRRWRGDAARVRRRGRRLVRSGGAARAPAVRRVARDGVGTGRGSHLGPHRAQPELLDGEGAACSASGRATPRSRPRWRRSAGWSTTRRSLLRGRVRQQRPGRFQVLAAQLREYVVRLVAHQGLELDLAGLEDGLDADVRLGVAGAVPVQVVTARTPAAPVVLTDADLGVRRTVRALDLAEGAADRRAASRRPAWSRRSARRA